MLDFLREFIVFLGCLTFAALAYYIMALAVIFIQDVREHRWNFAPEPGALSFCLSMLSRIGQELRKIVGRVDRLLNQWVD